MLTETTCHPPEFNQKTRAKQNGNSIRISSHALKRLKKRNIELSEIDLIKLEAAMREAEKKGAKETLVLTDLAVLLINVKNKTIITALKWGTDPMNIFTAIDSAVLLSSVQVNEDDIDTIPTGQGKPSRKKRRRNKKLLN